MSRLLFAIIPHRFVSPGWALVVLLSGLVASASTLALAMIVHSRTLLFVCMLGVGSSLGPLYATGMSYPISSPARYLLSSADVGYVVSTSNVGELITPLLISLLWATALQAAAYTFTTVAMALLSVITAIFLWRFCQ